MSEHTFEMHRTAAVLLGDDPGAWRPTDPHLRAFVEAAIVVRERNEPDFVGALLDGLRDYDGEHPWAQHYLSLVEEWDRIETEARAIVPLELELRGLEAWTRWGRALETRCYSILRELADWREAGEVLERIRARGRAA